MEWVASTPSLWLGVALWIVGWLILESLWYRREERGYSFAEARTSLGTFAFVSVAQVLVSLALYPCLLYTSDAADE